MIDHKTFPATSEGAWRKKCGEFVGQLVAYGRLLEQSGARGAKERLDSTCPWAEG